MTRHRLLSLLSLVLALVLPSVALAGTAEDFVKTRQSELTGLLKKPKSEANTKAIHGVFEQILDYDELAKRSLGSAEWKRRSAEERAEFTSLLKSLIQSAYEKNLRKTLGYSVSFKGETKDDGVALVRTVAKNTKDAREEPISIDYLVKGSKDQRIVDIVTEGSSLTRGYRSQFRRVLKKKGWSGLIDTMKKKRDEG
ncbi:MAG: ABC transporter substrate-binding protein [Polyangiaceae bacterium]|nr:ABC transporter substrate-binding protein [Polyangiaceae bacterium]